MNATDRYPALTLDTAPDRAQPLLRATRSQFGFVPAPVAKAAASPELLLASQAPELSALVPALRAGAALADARLEALRLFVRELVRERGQAGSLAWQRLERAGFTAAQALEIVLGVGVYVLSTFTNSVVDAALDPAFMAFAWQKPGARDPELD